MDNQDNNRNLFGLTFSENLKKELGSAAVWAKIAAIITFINLAVALLLNFKQHNIASAIIGAVISFMIAFYLYKFADETIKGVGANDQSRVNSGLSNLSTYFKIYGVLCILALVVVVLAVLIIVIMKR